MKFIKDLLFFEIQTTGQDPDKDSIIQLSAILLDKDNLLEKANFNTYIRVSYLDAIIQISAILLDKDNLLEKNNFNSYVRVSFLDSIINEHAKLLHTDYETLRKSPKIYDAIKNFHKKFGTNFLLATHGFHHLLFLKNAFKKALVTYDYDHHVVQLWTLGYVYTLNYGLKKMPTFHTFVDNFKLKQHEPWNSMEKVRLEAEIFRRIVKEV
ncbi:MAG TPA: exonuclease domain-containing protein [Candidatus Limnocylindria bacterium]|nr:exonuclease domain-containing protein [Candidatus Limnocylindria bacterium]